MKIENITVRYCRTGGFEGVQNEGIKHIKELPYLSVVEATEGHYSFGLGGETPKDLRCGESFIAPSLTRQEITHHVDAGSGHMTARWVFLDVIINDSIPFDLAFSLPTYPDPALCQAIHTALDAIFAARDILEKKMGCYALLRLLLPIATPRGRREARIETALNYLQKHFKEHLTVETLAGVVNMSAPNLYRLFKKEMGTSPMEYCNSLRLSHACMLLEQGNATVEEVSAVCGVGDAFYFSKLFKKKFGLSPAAYRKRLRQ